MPKISVFTPSHDISRLADCYKSLRNQTFDDWEWIVLLNGDASKNTFTVADERVRVYRDRKVQGVGAAKRAACAKARGEIMVELDHDDLLLPNALEKLEHFFSYSPSIGFVYSDTLQDGGARFSPLHGWKYRDDGSCVSFDAYPSNVSYIWYAPNHVRSFRRSLYKKVGGYDDNLEVLDDQDLMARMYQASEFYHISEALYVQTVHEHNTQRRADFNAKIQEETVKMYDRDIMANCLAWAKRNGLRALDFGGAHGCPEGFEPIDLRLGTDALATGLPDNSVGVIRACDFLEHVPDKVALMNECHRLLVHGGMLLTLTPSSDGRGAYQDPTHVSYWNQNSFWYYTDPNFAKFVPEITARFQASRLVSYFPTDWHRANEIPYVCANLISLKDGPRLGGINAWETTNES